MPIPTSDQPQDLPSGSWIAWQTPDGLVLNESMPLEELVVALRALAGRVQWLEANRHRLPITPPAAPEGRQDRGTALRPKQTAVRAATPRST